jgi:hypothetical protein
VKMTIKVVKITRMTNVNPQALSNEKISALP